MTSVYIAIRGLYQTFCEYKNVDESLFDTFDYFRNYLKKADNTRLKRWVAEKAVFSTENNDVIIMERSYHHDMMRSNMNLLRDYVDHYSKLE